MEVVSKRGVRYCVGCGCVGVGCGYENLRSTVRSTIPKYIIFKYLSIESFDPHDSKIVRSSMTCLFYWK